MRVDRRFVKMPPAGAVKDIRKPFSSSFIVVGIGIDIDRLFRQPVDAAQFIDAVAMIGMGMGVKNGVEFLQIAIEQLLPHIGRGIDQNVVSPCLDQNRNARAAVARIVRDRKRPNCCRSAARRPKNRSQER